MLDPRSWTHYCKDVAPNQKRYFDHDCGSGRTLIVSNSDKGFSAWCFRCSDSGFSAHPEPDLATRLAQLSAKARADDAIRQYASLPAGVTDPRAWPLAARVWLYKVGIGNSEIAELGALYSERMDRVVIPVYDNGELVYWQARGFTKGRPKWINPNIDKATVIPRYGTGTITVVTEDILSAFVVGKQAHAKCAMGTHLSDKLLAELLSERRPVAVWLDGDTAGLKGSHSALVQLRRWGIPSCRITTQQDPKELTDERIKHELDLALKTMTKEAL